MEKFSFRPRRPRIKVIERKLGQEKAWGVATFPALIELDSRLNEPGNGSRRLVYLIHEALHLAKWDLPEAEVKRISTEIGEVLWRDGYRRVNK